MTSIRLSGVSAQQRLLLARQIAPLRKQLGMTQAQLARAANVDRNTVGNAGSGVKAPQEDVLRPLFTVLGVETEDDAYDADVEQWLALIGALITAIDERHRARAVSEAQRVLAVAVQTYPNVGGGEQTPPDNVVTLRTNADDLDVDTIEAETRRAATTDDSAPNEFDTPEDDDPR